jgi:hypothetical protein
VLLSISCLSVANMHTLHWASTREHKDKLGHSRTMVLSVSIFMLLGHIYPEEESTGLSWQGWLACHLVRFCGLLKKGNSWIVTNSWADSK